MQQTYLRLDTSGSRDPYPWELSEETRRIGRAGLAVTRAILEAKRAESVPMVVPIPTGEATKDATRMAA